MTAAPVNNSSAFIPTTTVFPSDQQELLVRLTSTYAQTATAVNAKESGVYDQSEILNGQQWFDPNNTGNRRQSFRKVFSIGAIAAGATSTTAHEITDLSSYTHIFGTATTTVIDYRPIPYASATAANLQIEINVTAANIVIINGAAAPNITSALVVLEYLKN